MILDVPCTRANANYVRNTYSHPYKKIMPRTHVAICLCTMTHSCVSWHIHTWMTDSTKHVTLIRRVHSWSDVTKKKSNRHKSRGTGYCTTRNKKKKNACKNAFTLRSAHQSFPEKPTMQHFSNIHISIQMRMRHTAMRWLWLVGSIKLQVSFAKEPYKRDYILQKRPVI